MLDHRTETFMAVCSVMNLQGGGRAVTYYPAGQSPSYIQFLEESNTAAAFFFMKTEN